MNNRIRNFTRKTLLPQGHWCLLLAVVIAQVQLPIPLPHDHDSVESSVTLASHVDLRHDGQQDAESGFHWHWVFPGESHDQDAGEDESLPSPADVSDASAIATLRTNVAAAWDTDFVPLTISRLHRPTRLASVPTTEKRTVFDVSPISSATFSCAVLCVIRC